MFHALLISAISVGALKLDREKLLLNLVGHSAIHYYETTAVVPSDIDVLLEASTYQRGELVPLFTRRQAEMIRRAGIEICAPLLVEMEVFCSSRESKKRGEMLRVDLHSGNKDFIVHEIMDCK